MVTSALTPERMIVVERPGPAYVLGAIGLLVAALVVGGFTAWRSAHPRAGSLRCERARGQCALVVGRHRETLALAELTGARVETRHKHKIGTVHRLEVVRGAGAPRVIGEDSNHAQTAAEYRRAAAALEGFLRGSEAQLTLGWTIRLGAGELRRAGLATGALLIMVITLLALWVTRRVEVDRAARRITLRAAGPLRRRRTRTAALADVTRVVERIEKGRARIELALGDERWVVVGGGGTTSPAMEAARRALREGLERAIERAA